MEQQYVILMGNPGDGFRVIGPFQSIEDTQKYGESEHGDWWVLELDEPADD